MRKNITNYNTKSITALSAYYPMAIQWPVYVLMRKIRNDLFLSGLLIFSD